MIPRTVVLITLAASAAKADCAPGQELYLSCEIEGESASLSVCYDEETAEYRYGPIGGEPTLILTETIENLHFTPWPGVGGAIWDDVTFRHDGADYVVTGGIERIFPEDEDEEIKLIPFGGVGIVRDGEQTARLMCAPETIEYEPGGNICNYKQEKGQVWNRSEGRWTPAPK